MDLIKVEADVVSACGTVSETKMEIMIDEIVGRDRPANCRADDGPKQQPERVPITVLDRMKKTRQEQNNMESIRSSTEPSASGTPDNPYSHSSARKRVAREKSVVRCVKTHNKRIITDDCVRRVHVCKECGACYGRLSLLKKHMKTRHFVSEHQCDICDKCFYNAGSLNLHIATIHRGEKPFQCPTCDKCFTQKGNLSQHIRSIHERQNLVCEKCCKIFNQIGNLKMHALIHSGKKSYVCEFCGKGFTQSNGLIQHRLHCHLRAKPHPCPDCDMRFVTSSELKRHINHSHPTRCILTWVKKIKLHLKVPVVKTKRSILSKKGGRYKDGQEGGVKRLMKQKGYQDAENTWGTSGELRMPGTD